MTAEEEKFKSIKPSNKCEEANCSYYQTFPASYEMEPECLGTANTCPRMEAANENT